MYLISYMQTSRQLAKSYGTRYSKTEITGCTYLISCRHDLQTSRQLARSCGHRYKRIVSTTLVHMKTIVSCM
jgi:hypothetical protein